MYDGDELGLTRSSFPEDVLVITQSKFSNFCNAEGPSPKKGCESPDMIWNMVV